jgi:putative hydrolase of the HAD superfamily
LFKSRWLGIAAFEVYLGQTIIYIRSLPFPQCTGAARSDVLSNRCHAGRFYFPHRRTGDERGGRVKIRDMTEHSRARVLEFAIFDLDDTIYPRSAGVMQAIGTRIHQYMVERLGLDEEAAVRLRQEYLARYGTTMRGLIAHHHIDPEDYLEYVHQVPLADLLSPAPRLDAVLREIPAEKLIFTNASREHAGRVLRTMGIERHFTRIVDIRDMDYRSKPHPTAYQRLLTLLDAARPEACLLADDSVHNLRPAQELGMITVLVGDGHLEDGVDFVIEEVAEVGSVVSQLGV